MAQRFGNNQVLSIDPSPVLFASGSCNCDIVRGKNADIGACCFPDCPANTIFRPTFPVSDESRQISVLRAQMEVVGMDLRSNRQSFSDGSPIGALSSEDCPQNICAVYDVEFAIEKEEKVMLNIFSARPPTAEKVGALVPKKPNPVRQAVSARPRAGEPAGRLEEITPSVTFYRSSHVKILGPVRNPNRPLITSANSSIPAIDGNKGSQSSAGYSSMPDIYDKPKQPFMSGFSSMPDICGSNPLSPPSTTGYCSMPREEQ